MPNSVTPIGLVNVPIAAGATSPVPPTGIGSWAWSTISNQRIVWTGTSWSATGA